VRPDEEEMATGSNAGVGEAALIGAQKATIAEQLTRSEGYDMSSKIVNVTSGTVDVYVLEVKGLWIDGVPYAGRSRRRMQYTSTRDK
jgi:hypothetical protein